MLTTKDIKTLNAARKVLNSVMDEAWQPHLPTGTFEYGKLHETAEAAQDAIFHMLNTARAYCDIKITDDQMHMREEAKIDA